MAFRPRRAADARGGAWFHPDAGVRGRSVDGDSRRGAPCPGPRLRSRA